MQARIWHLQSPLTLIWGPPGTGKTQTIVVILVELLRAFPKSRILVTAPTHNAVDNILQRFINESGATRIHEHLRVSTSVSYFRLYLNGLCKKVDKDILIESSWEESHRIYDDTRAMPCSAKTSTKTLLVVAKLKSEYDVAGSYSRHVSELLLACSAPESSILYSLTRLRNRRCRRLWSIS